MKRRRFFRAALAASAAPALIAQQTQAPANQPGPTSPVPPAMNPQQPPAPLNRTPPPTAELPRLETGVADEVGETAPRFFNPQQFAALKKLSEIIMPPMGGAPGATEARAAEFLDFLIQESPQDRQQVYKAGLDQLNAQAKKQFNKTFSEVDNSQAATLLAPLKQPWTYDPPADPLARFLREAKRDIRTATMNSREYATNASAGGGRRGGGGGQYWYPLD